MRIEQCSWTKSEGWRKLANGNALGAADFVLYFGAPGTFDSDECFADLRNMYADARLLGCTTGGQILADEVYDETGVAVAVKLDKSDIRVSSVRVDSSDQSHAAGLELAAALKGDGLAGIFVLSDGMRVNGSDLVRGITDTLGNDLPLTGGLAGDGPDFQRTLVGLDANPQEGWIVAMGLYGSAIEIGHGSIGGWDVFGPERVITRSEGNVLYELDGKPALDLYKSYLGEQAEQLPGSALLFPLKIRPDDESDQDVVRTIVGVEEADQSMIFAGDVPEGYKAQLMRGNFENLIDGAGEAARMALNGNGADQKLAVLISCIGRKLLLGQRIGEEVEKVSEAMGADVSKIGFYSYGEISPHSVTGMCELHNQTMTVTVFSET